MGEMITAVYENGVLHPLTPLKLREHQRVRVQVLPDVAPDKETARERVERILSEAGMLQARTAATIPSAPISETERQALADRLGRASGKTTSEMVIEDRGVW